MKKKFSIIILSVLLIMATALPTMAAYYDEEYYQRTSDGKIYDISFIDELTWYTVRIKPNVTRLTSDQEDADAQPICSFRKKVKFTSSNKNVATISEKYNRFFKEYRYFAKLNKVGKTTIKFNNRPTRTIYISSYQNPCKSFKIGSTEYVSKFKKHPVACIGLKKGQEKKGKIHVQAAKGWKLKHIAMTTDRKDLNGKKIKNGQAIKLKGFNKIDQVYNMDNWLVYATFQNSKTKQYSCVALYSGKEDYAWSYE